MPLSQANAVRSGDAQASILDGVSLHPSVTINRSKIRLIPVVSYILDRMMTMSLGRPPGLADDDIDAELPHDIDCVEAAPAPRRTTNTSMSSSVHYIKL